MNILEFQKKKSLHEKITMVTCYDYSSARILGESAVDAILVGDSAAMTMHGYDDTISATLAMLTLHTKAVAKGAPEKFIVADLPFLTYRKSLNKTMQAAEELMQAGAQALKLEGAIGNLKMIRHLVESGIPIMGHLGLTLQQMHVLGGFKVQGKTEESAQRIKNEALLLEEAGCFSLVLECIPAYLAEEITQSLRIPTIGIGAGNGTDGQILVWQDLLGLNIDFKPKFVKSFVNGFQVVKSGIDSYVDEVKSGGFPSDENCYGN